MSIVHGSCLQYVSRKSEKYMGLTREGLEDAREILALSSHSAGTIAEDFPDLAGRTHSLPGGVDTDLFHPGAFDRGVFDHLEGGPGRGQAQRTSLREALESSGHAGEASARCARSRLLRRPLARHGRRRAAPGFLDREGPLLVYVGKLIHSKGVHSLISAFSRVRKETGARLLVIGFGTFREGLEALTCSLSAGDEATVERLAEMGRLLEGGPAGPLEHFELADELLVDAEGMEDDVLFVGPLYHGDLTKVLPPRMLRRSPPSSPRPSGSWPGVRRERRSPFRVGPLGLREAGEIVGRGLPFDLRVGMDGFEENFARRSATT